MFNNRAVTPRPNLPIVSIPRFKRDQIIFTLAVHGGGLYNQLDALVVALNKIGLVEGKHFYVNKPDVKVVENTLSSSQQRLFSVEFRGSGQVIHAILNHLENAVNVAIEVYDPFSTKNIIYADTSFFAKWVDEFLSQYNDNEPIIPAELPQVFAAHERQFMKLREALYDLAREETMLHAYSKAQTDLMQTLSALTDLDAAKQPASIRDTRFVYLLAALCHACKQASNEKIGLFDRKTKEAKVFDRYFELFEKYSLLMPTDLDPLQAFRDSGDITEDKEKLQNMRDAELVKIYNEKVAPIMAARESYLRKKK